MVYKMNTTKQAEFLSGIMQELDSDPEYPEADKQIIKFGYELIKPLLEPQRLYAGSGNGFYYIRLNGSTKLGTIAELEALGYKLHFLEPPFGNPIMLKKSD